MLFGGEDWMSESWTPVSIFGYRTKELEAGARKGRKDDWVSGRMNEFNGRRLLRLCYFLFAVVLRGRC